MWNGFEWINLIKWSFFDLLFVAVVFITLIVILISARSLRRFAIPVLAMMCGLVFASIEDHSMFTNWSEDVYTRSHDFNGLLMERPEVDGDRIRMNVFADDLNLTNDHIEQIQLSVYVNSLEERLSLEHLRPGDTLTFAGVLKPFPEPRNFDAFDVREFERKQGMFHQLSIRTVGQIQCVSRSWSSILTALPWLEHPLISSYTVLKRFAGTLRNTISNAFMRTFSNDRELAGLLVSMQLGDRDAIDFDEQQMFTQFGMSHVLAISGSNVAIWTTLMLYIAKWCRQTVQGGQRLALWSIPFYVLLTGADASVVRAGVMAMMILWAASKNEQVDPIHVLFAGCWLILLFKPFWLLDIGFQLSVLVTIGLLSITKLQIKHPRLVWFVIPLMAAWISFPHAVWTFHQFSWMSIPLNVILVPLFGFILTPISAIIVFFDVFLPHIIFTPLIALVEGAYRCIQFGFELAKQLEPYPITVPSSEFPLLWWCAFTWITVKLFHGVINLEECFSKTTLWTVVVFIIFIIFTIQPQWLQQVLAYSRGEDLTLVRLLDVGQGDASFVRTPNGFTMLIDAGPIALQQEAWKERRKPFDTGRDVIVPLLRAHGVHNIDALVLSHEDLDHIGGALAVMKAFHVKEIWYNGLHADKPFVHELFKFAAIRNIPLRSIQAGMILQLEDGTVIRSFGPLQETVNQINVPQNDASVVLKVEMHHFSFLFSGDLPQTEEHKILDRYGANALKSDVLKVGHHGSKTSTSDEWLQAVRPVISFISAGIHNRYHHPNADVLERIQSNKSNIHRTDENGELQFRCERGKIVTRAKNPA